MQRFHIKSSTNNRNGEHLNIWTKLFLIITAPYGNTATKKACPEYQQREHIIRSNNRDD